MVTKTLQMAAVALLWGVASCGVPDHLAVDGGAPDAAASDAGLDAGTGALSLALGEIADLDVDDQGVAEATLATPQGSEEFLVQLMSGATAVDQVGTYQIHVEGISQKTAVPAPPRRHPISASPHNPRTRGRGCLQATGHDLAEATERLRGLDVPRGVLHPPLPPPPPAPGETLLFQIDTPDGATTIQAEVLRVTAFLVVALDRDTDPVVDVDATRLDEITTGFDQVVLPRMRIFFGQESDVNGDGRVTLLFSPLVEEYGTAYVNPYDLITDPAARPPDVVANDQELIYVTPPALLEPMYATSRALLETLAHELGHAIYFFRKYLLNANPTGVESVYITEGLAALAQDLAGYQNRNFFVSKEGLDSIDQLSWGDLIGSDGTYLWSRDGALRGGAYHLLRYCYDQAGGDTLLPSGDVDLENSPGIPWLRGLVDAPDLGEASLTLATGPLSGVILNWFTAMLVDDRLDALGQPLNTDLRYNFLPTAVDPLTGRTRGTSMFESLLGTVHKTGPLVLPLADADGLIRLGGVEYLHLQATAAPETHLTIMADPERVMPSVRIFRIR